MGKYLKVGICLCFCLFTLAGCGQAEGPETVEDTTLSVSGEGKITAYLVGDFGKAYYSLAELTDMVKVEAAGYNTSSGNADVEVLKVELLESDNSKVVIQFQYSGSEAYSAYNEASLFYGTVSEAFGEGYSLSSSVLTAVADGTPATESYLSQDAAGQHILITDERAIFYCPYKVLYLSKGAVLNDDGSVDTRACEGESIILMKK